MIARVYPDAQDERSSTRSTPCLPGVVGSDEGANEISLARASRTPPAPSG